MGSIVLKSLSVLLGIFFLFVGTLKISPVISKELHKDLVRINIDNNLILYQILLWHNILNLIHYYQDI